MIDNDTQPNNPKQVWQRMNRMDVLLPQPFDQAFTYIVPERVNVQAGDYVSVPFGKKQLVGVVWGESTGVLDEHKLKIIEAKLDATPMAETMRQYIDWIAWYTLALKGAVLKMALPGELTKAGKFTGLRKAYVPQPLQSKPKPLSDAQQQAADQLVDQLNKGFGITLIDGVTGSGKTEVYFEAIESALKQEKQVLVLLPEIALSVQWLARFEARFGMQACVWHSSVTPGVRKQTWHAVASGDAKLVVGARSALFLPFNNLGLIIVDEEHESSYKQEEGVIYHARDMAIARAKHEDVSVILASATPSLETIHNVLQGKYQEVKLPERHFGASFPDVKTIDMRLQSLTADTFVSEPLKQAFLDTLGQGHQSILFMNRRGYAPLVLCRACGHRYQCPQCSAWLVMHKARPKLQCHHCGYVAPLPDKCEECGAEDKLHACGPGVERIKEEVEALLPNARIEAMTSDVARNIEEARALVSAMEEGEIDILIGTQMIAKGYHFPKLAFIGVVDADFGLVGSDLRAAERTYQLLHQLSGRAGREKVKGNVLLQSYLPEHPVMQALAGGSREAFNAAEQQYREESSMPPYSRLAAIIVEGANEQQVIQMAKQLASLAPVQEKITILGPAPAPLLLLRGQYRYRLLVKADKQCNVQHSLRSMLSKVKVPRSLKLKVDIDPQQFL
jgi:primosomal protein N' (replication factor Y)